MQVAASGAVIRQCANTSLIALELAAIKCDSDEEHMEFPVHRREQRSCKIAAANCEGLQALPEVGCVCKACGNPKFPKTGRHWDTLE